MLSSYMDLVWDCLHRSSFCSDCSTTQSMRNCGSTLEKVWDQVFANELFCRKFLRFSAVLLMISFLIGCRLRAVNSLILQKTLPCLIKNKINNERIKNKPTLNKIKELIGIYTRVNLTGGEVICVLGTY